jgi:UDP-N-acetylmuramate: L-alanyl-gamma-D-glutamyl-meso-diaminopimelate ligase
LGGSIASFKGLSRRQEVRFDREVTLVEDFAHHPTAVRETIAGMKERYAGRRLWAVFEPRSNTSRRRVFQEPYVEAFRSADEVILCEVVARHNDEGVAMLSVGVLAEQIAASGIHAVVLPDAERIREHLLAQIREGDVILLMSNGSFGGLPAALEEALRLRFPNGGTVAGQNSSSSGGCRLGAGGGAGFGSD